jgi:hypothetical protein
MLKNPLAISLALLGCLVALAFAKGKSIRPEDTPQRHPASASTWHSKAIRPGSLQSEN